MFIALSFRGKLPEYVIYCVQQARLFFDGDIYLITDDLSSPHLDTITAAPLSVKVVPYEEVRSEEFAQVERDCRNKFHIIEGLHDRCELFIRSFERFFLLKNLMSARNLGDCLFLEIDVLIYEDPRKFAAQFAGAELCYTFDNIRRASGCYTFVKSAESLEPLLIESIHYIYTSPPAEFLNEMTVLYLIIEKLNKFQPGFVHLLPVYWPDTRYPPYAHKNFATYQSIFDAQPIGVYLLGIDVMHSGGKVKPGLKPEWCMIDYRKNRFEWRADDAGRNIPYIWCELTNEWARINNLHVHSKDLKSGLSIAAATPA